MFYVELDHDSIVTLDDMTHMLQHIVEDYKVTEETVGRECWSDITFILNPALSLKENEFDVRLRWQRLVDHLTVNDQNGQPVKFFYNDDHSHLYFGDKKGQEVAKMLDSNTQKLKKSFQSDMAHKPH